MSDSISTLIGILVDVSNSMRSSIGDGVEEESNAWVKSVITVIDDLIKYDLSSSNHMFSVGVGTVCGNGILDVMRTLEQFQKHASTKYNNFSFDDKLDVILGILEKGGAKHVRKWADIKIIKEVASINMLNIILQQLESSEDFVKAFVNDFLPEVCTKGIKHKEVAGVGIGATMGTGLALSLGFTPLCLIALPAVAVATAVGVNKAESAVGAVRPANKDEVEEVLSKVKNYLMKTVSIEASFFSVHEAHRIIHGCVDDEDLNEKRRKELLDIVEPFIFGYTPMYKALQTTTELFLCDRYSNHKKLLFIVSDGVPTDSGKKDILSMLHQNANISVVSCYITRSTDIEPKRLYSQTNYDWDDGAKFLFGLSSRVTTQLLPRTIFIKRGWKIDIENNETRLFLQINHPDHIKDACDLARNVVCCQDALTDLLSSVSLDLYINQYTGEYPAHLQEQDTCYANATAAIIHLATKRIHGRKDGYPDFDELRQDLIRRYGQEGANTLRVLREVCPTYRLHCETVNTMGALRAVTAKRPVVATFRLTDREWVTFRAFFQTDKKAILSKKEIDISKRLPGENVSGHAVILTSFNSEGLRFMNSWGTNWGDVGFFRVQKAEVLDFKFFYVYWKLDDLFPEEKDYYEKHGSEVAADLINKLKGLQVSEYQCPLCKVKSLVTDFSGTLLQAKCPKCHKEFKCGESGNILALNIYLTSLSR